MELSEAWETFSLKFTMFYPFDLKPDETFYLTVDRLGSKQILMDSAKIYEEWLYPKYGQEMKIQECELDLPNTTTGPHG